MKVLTAAQMREADRRTIEADIPGIVLMENAGCRVVEFLDQKFSPLRAQRILVVCGKGNNGGDGLVVARQLLTRFQPAALWVLLASAPEEFQGDAATNWTMLRASGLAASREITSEMRGATVIVDALLGTGLKGPAEGRALELIREMNRGFPNATIVSIDVPSGLHADGESVEAQYTVTLAAPKTELVIPPTCDRVGELIVEPIGIPREFLEDEESHWLNLVEPSMIARFCAPRPRASNKGNFGHVLVIGGAAGKGGAAAMTGSAALRAGAGLVTVAVDPHERATVTSLMPELMTTTWDAGIEGRNVLAIGPGLGQEPAARTLVEQYFETTALPMVVDADALNILAGTKFHAAGRVRILTPHPGEMGRLTGTNATAVQADRVNVARAFAQERGCIVVLKGQRTVIAMPDGKVFINPTGTPAMATAGSGDVLTGLIAGLLGQFPNEPEEAVLAAVWLHGRSGEIGAAEIGEQSFVAMELLHYLPTAMRELASVS